MRPLAHFHYITLATLSLILAEHAPLEGALLLTVAVTGWLVAFLAARTPKLAKPTREFTAFAERRAARDRQAAARAVVDGEPAD